MSSTRLTHPVLLAVTAGALIAGGAGAGVAVYAESQPAAAPTVVKQVVAGATNAADTSSAGDSVNQIYKNVSPGVVEITVDEGSSAGSFPNGQSGGQAQALGTGWVYNSNGDIVTDEHVVAGATSIHVTLQDGTTVPATLVGADGSTDVAVIHINVPSSELHPQTVGDSSGVQVGDGVVAIGSPFGLAESVTSGIVSQLHRQITSPDNFPINDAIQTDAAINHGNSGGVLLNMQGQVIGMTAQIESQGGGSDGVGFAIPSNTVKQIADELIANGHATHAYLGVGVVTVPSGATSQLHLAAGVEVTQVRKGTGAAKAGLKAATGTGSVNGSSFPTGGDVITAVNGTSVKSASELEAAIAGNKPGDTVTLTISRGGSTQSVSVTLGSRPS